jgi:hypothetical protein
MSVAWLVVRARSWESTEDFFPFFSTEEPSYFQHLS